MLRVLRNPKEDEDGRLVLGRRGMLSQSQINGLYDLCDLVRSSRFPIDDRSFYFYDPAVGGEEPRLRLSVIPLDPSEEGIEKLLAMLDAFIERELARLE